MHGCVFTEPKQIHIIPALLTIYVTICSEETCLGTNKLRYIRQLKKIQTSPTHCQKFNDSINVSNSLV